jgi:protein N-lysine methyltransferase METTL21A
MMADELHSPSSSPEHDPLFGFESLAPVRVNNTASTTALSLENLLDPPLVLHQDLKEGCGGQLWPAGMVLARYMLRHHRHDLADKTM